MWCSTCYTSPTRTKFHVKKPDYEEKDMPEEERERLRSAWGKKRYRPDNFLVGRNGDHTMVPFECDYCIFHKLRKVIPKNDSPVDQLLLDLIRRTNLDAFWSRARGTVEGNYRSIKKMQHIADTLELEGPFKTYSIMPDHDHCGYEVAVIMLKYSLQSGKYNKNALQFETVRKLRGHFSNFTRCSTDSIVNPMVLGNMKGQYQRLTGDPAGSMWFSRFMEGMKKRMGHISKPNLTMSPALLRRLLILSDERIFSEENEPKYKDKWIVFNTYAVVCYVISLRGNEGFLLDLGALRNYYDRGVGKYITIPLLGMFKGESEDMAHLIPCCELTSSGINLRQVLGRLIHSKELLGVIDGPAISDEKGFVLQPSEIDEMLHSLLMEIYKENKDLFPPEISKEADIKDNYQCFRTFRRTSNTRAKNMKVTKSDIETVNRWRKIENAQGNRPSLPMDQHYASFQDLLQPFLNYTQKM